MATITLEYDGRNSDIKQLIRLLFTFNGEGGYANQYAFANKNNVVSANYGGEKWDYSYTYSDDIPVSRSRSVVDHYTQGYRYVETTITYYEYVK